MQVKKKCEKKKNMSNIILYPQLSSQFRTICVNNYIALIAALQLKIASIAVIEETFLIEGIYLFFASLNCFYVFFQIIHFRKKIKIQKKLDLLQFSFYQNRFKFLKICCILQKRTCFCIKKYLYLNTIKYVTEYTIFCALLRDKSFGFIWRGN